MNAVHPERAQRVEACPEPGRRGPATNNSAPSTRPADSLRPNGGLIGGAFLPSTSPPSASTPFSFLLRAGTVTGREHLRLGRNNQDGAAVLEKDGFAVAVVTDGCGSGPSSEVGARLGARFLARRILNEARRSGLTSELPTRVCESLVSFLFTVARGLDVEGDGLSDDIAQQFLFTFQCAVMDGERALVFGVGDGVVAVDGIVTTLEPGPDNAPAYLGYRLVPQSRLPADFRAHAATAPVVHHFGPADTAALATDGLSGAPAELLALAADAGVWSNAFALSRRLNVLAARPGAGLIDDSTVALLKRDGIADPLRRGSGQASTRPGASLRVNGGAP